MKKWLNGVHVPHRKNTAEAAPVLMTPSAQVVLPMSMHIGRPAVPLVKVGDTVKVGQKIAEAGGYVSAPVHASVSGKVKALEERLNSAGQHVSCIVIESDGLMEKDESIVPPQIHSYEEFIAAVAQSGLVGLGGAGFPASVKLDIKDLSRLDTVIINGAECEPYITSDTRTMLDRGEEIAWGIKMLETYLKAKRVIIGIEKNKPQCIRAMEQLAAKDSCVSVLPLPALYPQGGEKVLIYHATGRIVGEGKLPIDAGVIVMNCTSLADMGRYFLTGMPLVEKCVTVDGSAIKDPKNVLVPIGTSLKDLIDFAGGCKAPAGKVLYGGPMMGISVPDLEQPVLKTTNAVTAFNEADARTPDPTACIRCGSCESAVTALVDSGNLLCDPLSGDPVLILPRNTFRRLTHLPEGSTLLPGMRLLRARTASGITLMIVLRPDGIFLLSGWKETALRGLIGCALSGGGVHQPVMPESMVSAILCK